MIPRIPLMLGLVGILTASPVVWAVPIRSPRQVSERGVYEAMLKSLLRGVPPSVSVVQADPLVLRPLSAADWQWFEPETDALRAKIEVAGSSTPPRFTP